MPILKHPCCSGWLHGEEDEGRCHGQCQAAHQHEDLRPHRQARRDFGVRRREHQRVRGEANLRSRSTVPREALLHGEGAQGFAQDPGQGRQRLISLHDDWVRHPCLEIKE